MRDYLLDVAKHTVPLSAFQNLRVDGTATSTDITATDVDKHLVLMAKTHQPVTEFIGTFGIPNLSLLNTLLNIPEYSNDKAKTSVSSTVREDSQQPTAIHFENEKGDFQNDFRLMSKTIIDNLSPTMTFNVKTWPISFVSSLSSQQRLKYQTSAHPDEKNVTFEIENGKITAYLGDVSSHSGSFVFHDGLAKNEKHRIIAPVNYVNSVFNLTGDKMVYMGPLGMMISIDSGLVQYNYIIPGLSK